MMTRNALNTVCSLFLLTSAVGCADDGPSLVLTEAKASTVQGSYRADGEVLDFTATLTPTGARELHIRSGARSLIDVVGSDTDGWTIQVDGASYTAALTGDAPALAHLTEFAHSPEAAAVSQMAYDAAQELRLRMAGDWPAWFERLPGVIHLEVDAGDSTFTDAPECECLICLWTDGARWFGLFCTHDAS